MTSHLPAPVPRVPRQNEPGMLSGTTVTKNSQRPRTSPTPSATNTSTAGPPVSPTPTPTPVAARRAAVAGPNHRSSRRTAPRHDWSDRRASRAQFSAVAVTATTPAGSTQRHVPGQRWTEGERGGEEPHDGEGRVPRRPAGHHVQAGRGEHARGTRDGGHRGEAGHQHRTHGQRGVQRQQSDLAAEPRTAQVAQRLPRRDRAAEVAERPHHPGGGQGRGQQPVGAGGRRWR